MAATQQQGYELYKFTEKVVLYDIVIVHSLQGVLKVNTDSILDHFSESIHKIKLINCQSHLDKDFPIENLENLTSTFVNPNRDDSEEEEGNFDLYILDNLESIHLIDARKLLAKLIHQVSNTNGHKLWILASSENLYLLNDYTDRYPEILSQTFEIDEESQIPFVSQILPTKEDFKNLPGREQKFLWARVAKHKSILLEKRTKKRLYKVYPKNFIYPNHIQINEQGSVEDTFFSLVPSEASRYIEKKSKRPWNRFRTNKDLKWFALIFLTIILGIFILWYNAQNYLEKKHNTEIAELNLRNQLLINSNPGEVLNSIVDQEYKNINMRKEQSIFKWIQRNAEQFKFSKKKKEIKKAQLDKKLIVPVYNANPQSPSKRPFNWNSFSNNNNTDFDISGKYVHVLRNDSLYIFEVDDDGMGLVLPVDSVERFKSNEEGDVLLVQKLDKSLHKITPGDTMPSILLFPKSGEEDDNTTDTSGNEEAEIIDFDIDSKGENYAYILSDSTLYYSGTQYSTKSMSIIKADILNSRVHLLWDKYIGISNNAEFKLYRIIQSKRRKFGFTERIRKGQLWNFRSLNGYNGHNFSGEDGRFSIDEFPDESLVAFSIYNPKILHNKNAYIIKFSFNPETIVEVDTNNALKPYGLKLKGNSSMTHKIDYINQKIFVGQNDENIRSFTFKLGNHSLKKHRFSQNFKPVAILDTTEYIGHRAAISQMEFFENEQILASLSRDNELILWNYNGIKLFSYHFPPNTKIKMSGLKTQNAKLYILNEGKIFEIAIAPLITGKPIPQFHHKTKNVLVYDAKETSSPDSCKFIDASNNIFFSSPNYNSFKQALLLEGVDNSKELIFSVKYSKNNKHDKVYKITYDTSFTFQHEIDSSLIIKVKEDQFVIKLKRDSVTMKKDEFVPLLSDQTVPDTTNGVFYESIYEHPVELVDTFSSGDKLNFYFRNGTEMLIHNDCQPDQSISFSLLKYFNAEQLATRNPFLIDVLADGQDSLNYLVAIAHKDKITVVQFDRSNKKSLILYDHSFTKEIKHVYLYRSDSKFKLQVSFQSKEKDKWIPCLLPLENNIDTVQKILFNKYYKNL